MSDHLRDRLHDEMAGLDRPALDGLVAAAVTQGSHIRRRRRLLSGAGTTAAVGAVAAVVALGGQVLPRHGTSVAAVPGSAPATVALAAPTTTAAAAPATTQLPPAAPSKAAPATTASAPETAPGDLQVLIKAQLAKLHADKPGSASAGADKEKLATLAQVGPVTTPSALPPGVSATPTGMLELLTRLLPGASHQGVTDDGSLGVEAYVTTPAGDAMVRVGLARVHDVPVGCTVLGDCTVKPNGDIVTVRHLTDNCIGTDSVEVIRPDGSDVALSLATCLEWDGTQNAASPQAMTIGQATAIVEDPRWDVSMDPTLVTAGAAHFPSPHQFG